MVLSSEPCLSVPCLQDTLKAKPSESSQMKKATTTAIFVTTSFYMGVALVGYAAFGDNAPGNLLTGFGFYNPYWLIDIANVFIMVHLVGAYQVWDGKSSVRVFHTLMQVTFLHCMVHGCF